MRFVLGVPVLLVTALPAFGHGLSPDAVEPLWTLDPWVLVPLAAAAVLYVLGVARIRSRASGWRKRRSVEAGAFAVAWLALAGALVSPLHWLGEHLFAFHMIEHEIIMAMAAPLFVLARPAGVMLWALPATCRRAIGSTYLRPSVRGLWRRATRPRNATVLHAAAIWLWHVPTLFDAAVTDVTLHRLQHLSFLFTALLFWWAVLRRSGSGPAVWHLFVTMVHTSVLGAWIALAPRVLFHLQTVDAPFFGLTPLEDQQLAGVIMWVPAETVYAGAALAMAALWIGRSRRRTPPFLQSPARPGSPA